MIHPVIRDIGETNAIDDEIIILIEGKNTMEKACFHRIINRCWNRYI